MLMTELRCWSHLSNIDGNKITETVSTISKLSSTHASAIAATNVKALHGLAGFYNYSPVLFFDRIY